ncbi:sensor histidine kinase [Bacillus swezeyi]|uniref:sensor histidine kinase n=1 Tax=Bacillus swezeyi TaxID=1925020 RepID=UPI0027DE9BE1|nr:sensor histidine kinase [Bacillus swezeyi]MED2942798.1 sensor histidine kinase [Bacillus swezeyi]MED2976470.1 sensor histidine kinase [Bacillus swezeyi]
MFGEKWGNLIKKVGQLVKKDGYILLLMLLTVPLAGELKFYPLNETFRISFGVPTFFFFLLLLRNVPAVLPGLLTGAAIVAFRVLLDVLGRENADWLSAFYHHYPTFFFYFTYAFLFYLAKVKRFQYRPIFIGFLGFAIEIIADGAELTVQYLTFASTVTPEKIRDIMAIAFSHSFIVLSFFNVMKLYESQSREKQIREQNEHMLMIISNLYEETIHLKKTLKNTEQITNDSYQLYRLLNKRSRENPLEQSLSQKVLRLAGEIHEVKKDNQRIFAGLSKLISNENFRDYMNADDLVRLVIGINHKYAESLGKDIDFQYTISGEHPKYHVYTILSMINNVMANAVEAIEETGCIRLSLYRSGEGMMECQVEDDGPGIPEKIGDVVFEPGYTSKYDEFGTPSTGIGLSYVKEAVEELGGGIAFRSHPNGVVFSIRLPIQPLIQKG